MIERFAPFESPEDVIRDAMAARLSFGDLSGSPRHAAHLYEKAGFNDEAKFGLLCNAVMVHLELAHLGYFLSALGWVRGRAFNEGARGVDATR